MMINTIKYSYMFHVFAHHSELLFRDYIYCIVFLSCFIELVCYLKYKYTKIIKDYG